MPDTGDLGAKELRAAALREHDQAGLNAAGYYDPPGFGEGIDCTWAVGPVDCNTARNDAETAKLKTRTHFPEQEGHNDQADAFRHCYWNALMTVHIGADQAKAVADVHEENNPNDPAESVMDQHNNHVGRTLGAKSEAGAESQSLAAAKDGRLKLAP